MDNMRKKYTALSIVRRQVELDAAVLATSVVTLDTEVRTTGQKVEEYNFSEVTFNQVWE